MTAIETVFADEDTQCHREGNRCKKRKKCNRYMRDRHDGWEANYWGELGEFCQYFQEMNDAGGSP